MAANKKPFVSTANLISSSVN